MKQIKYNPEDYPEDMYIDCSPINIRTTGFQMCSIYTRLGIKRIDSDYCDVICNYHSTTISFIKEMLKKGIRRGRIEEKLWIFKQAKEGNLEQHILDNPNLHPKIKNNLLLNLHNFKTHEY